jgi:hypothetical protein
MCGGNNVRCMYYLYSVRFSYVIKSRGYRIVLDETKQKCN